MYQEWADELRGKQDDDLAEETEVMVYNPSGLNFAIEDHFAELQLNLPIAIGGRVMSPHMQLCPAHLDESSPHGLLYLAAYANRPELHVPVVKRKRLEKGQHVHHALGKALAMLQSNPSSDVGWPITFYTRKRGHREYARQLGLRQCIYYKTAFSQSRDVFYQQTDAVQGSWVMLAEVCRVMFTTTTRGLVLNSLPGVVESHPVLAECAGLAIHDAVHKCHSGMFTWHSDVGLHHPQMKSLVDSKCDVESMEASMGHMACFASEFKLFCEHIQKLVSVTTAQCYACCMEHCRHGQQRGRVHFHAYIGSAATWVRDSGISPPLLELPMGMLTFRGYQAHARLTRLKGNSSAKQASNNASQGVYYIMAPKLGQLSSCGSHLPFEDT